MKLQASVFFSLFFGFTGSANSYPDLIRHGYFHCLICHSSQNGGDLLSDYGREINRELVSSSFWSSEEKAARTPSLPGPEWLRHSVQNRWLQVLQENSQISRGRFLLMQLDYDALMTISQKIKFYFSVGRFDPQRSDVNWRDFFYFPRVWIGYEFDQQTEDRAWQIRLGKFFPTYGINFVDHSLLPRQFLGFAPGQEKLVGEISYSQETLQVFVSSFLAQTNYNKSTRDSGGSFQINTVLQQHYKLGLNFFQSDNLEAQGALALLGWNEQHSSLLQVDHLNRQKSLKGWSAFWKQDYEWTQGSHGFLLIENYSPEASSLSSDSSFQAYGLGVQYFWLPTVDVTATYKKYRNPGELNEFQDLLIFLAHLSL